MARTLRAELGTDHGTVKRVAAQLGYGAESVRSWVRQTDVDEGHVAGVSTSESARMNALEQEVRELKRANYGERLAEIGVTPSIGTVADSYDNALV